MAVNLEPNNLNMDARGSSLKHACCLNMYDNHRACGLVVIIVIRGQEVRVRTWVAPLGVLNVRVPICQPIPDPLPPSAVTGNSDGRGSLG